MNTTLWRPIHPPKCMKCHPQNHKLNIHRRDRLKYLSPKSFSQVPEITVARKTQVATTGECEGSASKNFLAENLIIMKSEQFRKKWATLTTVLTFAVVYHI